MSVIISDYRMLYTTGVKTCTRQRTPYGAGDAHFLFGWGVGVEKLQNGSWLNQKGRALTWA